MKATLTSSIHLLTRHLSLALGAFFVALSCLSLHVEASQPTSNTTIKLGGQWMTFQVDGVGFLGNNNEKFLPIQFQHGAKGILTSSVVFSADDLQPNTLNTKILNTKKFPFAHFTIARTASPQSALELVQELQSRKEVRFAHPDFIFPIEARNDPKLEPFYAAQWNLHNVGQNGGTPGVDLGTELAWQRTRGNADTIVAVLDLGFDQAQKDMDGAWFVNSREIPANKKDDDGNGLIDDVMGWNFSTNSAKLIYGAAPSHGTATSGVVGARANGIGISGVCPECKVLPVVVSGRVSEDAAAISYAAAMGAAVMSNSWGYGLESPRTDVVYDAINRAVKSGRSAKGIPILFAMRNASVDDCRGANPDISSHPDVIAISSIDHNDVKVAESAFGKCLAFLGPSSGSRVNGIPSTDRTGAAGYNTDGVDNFADLDFHNGFWGTSAATPQVAGLFALLLSAEPQLTRDQAYARMKSSVIKANPSEAAYDAVSGHSLRYGFGRAHGGRMFSPK